MYRRPSDRGDRSTLAVILGDSEIRIKAPECSQTAKVLQRALQIMRKRSIDEEEAKNVMDAFEEALSGPLQYKGAHLCLAEMYISGCDPQLGKDDRRAVSELVTYLDCFVTGSQPSDAAPVMEVARETARLAQHLDSSSLAPLQGQFVKLGKDIPVLQGAALRASLARLDRIDGSSTAPGAQGPMEFLDKLLRDLVVSQRDKAMLSAEVKEQRSQLALLNEALEDARERRDAAEELVCRFSTSAEHIHSANERLVERMEAEMLRVDQAERHASIAEADAEELRKECQRLRQELENERRGNASQQRAERERFGGQRGSSLSCTLGSARKSMVAQQSLLPSRPATRPGSVTARGESPSTARLTPSPAPSDALPTARETPSSQVLQGYTNSYRAASPMRGVSREGNALDNLLSARRQPSPAPSPTPAQQEEPKQTPVQSSASEFGLRDQNGRSRLGSKLEVQKVGCTESPRPTRELGNFSSAGRRMMAPSPSVGKENALRN